MPVPAQSANISADDAPPQKTAAELRNDAIALLRAGRFRELAELVSAALKTAPQFKQGIEVALANRILLGGPWSEIASLIPANWNTLAATGWLRSLAEGKPINDAGAPIPWITYPAIELLERLAQPNWRVLEWGCGASTLWWASRVASVLAIEHQPAWAGAVQASLPPNARLLLRPEPASYLAAIEEAGTDLDVIVIDGEQRPACAALVARHLAPSGIVVFDNSDRRGYAEALVGLAAQGFHRIDLYGLAPCYLYKGCTSILFRDPAVLALQPPPSSPAGILGPTVAQALGE